MQWTDLEYPVLQTDNHKLVHSSTGLTPNDARNQLMNLKKTVNMELKAKSNRTYPETNIREQTLFS